MSAKATGLKPFKDTFVGLWAKKYSNVTKFQLPRIVMKRLPVLSSKWQMQILKSYAKREL